MKKSFADDFFDWRLTACFYASLHYLCAFIAKCKVCVPPDHKQTKLLLDPDGKNILGMETIPFQAYLELYDYAYKARYTKYGYDISGINLTLIKVDFEQAITDLKIIRDFIVTKGIKLN